MNRPKFIIALLVLTVIIIISFSVNNFYLSDYSDTMRIKTDEFIQVVKLSERVIVVKIGYDAVTAIATQKGIVVIDAGISNSLTAKYREIIEKVFNRNDFAYLLITHSHWDHTGGNQVFKDAVIIGHKNCLNEMTEYWKDKEKIKSGLQKIISHYEKQLKNFDPEWQDSLEIEKQRIRYQAAYNDLMTDRLVTLPVETFKDTMNLYIEDLSFYLIYFGLAHSGSDILIYIPELKLLMTGDLFSEGGRASFNGYEKKDIKRWMTVKTWIEQRMNSIENVINGHGYVMSKNDLTAFIKYVDEKGME